MSESARDVYIMVQCSPSDDSFVWHYELRPEGEGFLLTTRLTDTGAEDLVLEAWVSFDEALPRIEPILSAQTPIIPDVTSLRIGGHVDLKICVGVSSCSFWWGETPANWSPLQATVAALTAWIHHKTHYPGDSPTGGDPSLMVIKEGDESLPVDLGNNPGSKQIQNSERRDRPAMD